MTELSNHITYIEMESVRDAAFHFSVEDYIMRNLSAPVLMIWQTDPCVMLGINQSAESEIDIEYANREGIKTIRRPGGGGAIYTDAGTLLYTLISDEAEPETAQRKAARYIACALNELGIPAEFEGRNDICAEGRKISGIAQYVRHKKICTHGSLLYETDLDKLARVLRTDEKKFYGKTVRSVRSRVANVNGYIAGCPSILTFKEMLKKKLLKGKEVTEYRFNPDELAEIQRIYDGKYNDPAWTFGRMPQFTYRNGKRFAGGTLEVLLGVKDGAVQSCAIRGDFLGTVPIRGLERLLEGKAFNRDVLFDALTGFPLRPYLGNISVNEFLSCVFEAAPPKPDWLRVRHSAHPNQAFVAQILRDLNINTVCREADCPHCAECYSRKTATFMILGTSCTRDCRFCNVRTGTPKPPNPNEPENIARAVSELGLKYVVITSVTRDDLPDGGASFFARVIEEVSRINPETAIEVLIPDFSGNINALKTVTDAQPHVIGHNMETVESLYTRVRPQAEYRRSLRLIKSIKQLNKKIRSKSGFMLGLGETDEEVRALLNDLKEADCEILTIGQYLAPSASHIPVWEYVTPRRFEEWGHTAREIGFAFTASAPLVRSSYRADEAYTR
ncbi:MAG: lipoyl synthase [Defluviitaleaceae bacterium]|nr:lipoyl synthase [Defluviitaleaceae bacterium]